MMLIIGFQDGISISRLFDASAIRPAERRKGHAESFEVVTGG
jgi:hypothetical protein